MSDQQHAQQPSDLHRAAVDAWIFGYPLVLMDLTRRVMGAHGEPVNTIDNVRTFPDHTFTDVVSPNADTLYSTAWLDLRAEPLVLSLPATHGRYHTLPVLSGWTDVFVAPGSRTTGDAGTDLALCPPGWSGELPDGVTRVDAPTSLAWLIGRTATAGTRDYLAVHALQDQYLLTPLSAYDDGQPAPRPVTPWPTSTDTTPPVDQVARMDGAAYFARLADLLVDNPPTPADADAMAGLARFIDADEPGVAEAIAAAPAAGQAELRRIGQRIDVGRVNGWSLIRGLGDYGTDYAKRAYVAFVALGATLDADAIYPRSTVDSDGRALSGEHNYVVHFEAGQLPPVQGFWSLTVYDDKQFFVDNELDRYALGDRDPLEYNQDGSLDLWLCLNDPGDARAQNWLPTPSGSYNVILRAYWPGPAVLTGQWSPPPLVRTD